MLYLFDMDGTLITGYMDRPDRDYNRWSILPGRKARLQQLVLQGHVVGIVTNQGGVAFGHVTEAQAADKLLDAFVMLGLAPVRSSGDPWVPPIYVCYSDVRGKPPWNDPADAARRKPSGAMIREAMADYPRAAALGVLYVGDRPEDEAAAADAGVPFMWADQFFAEKAA